MLLLLVLSRREMSGCTGPTGTKEEATFDMGHDPSHLSGIEPNAEISSFPLYEATCREKQVVCKEVKGRTSQGAPLFYFLNRSRADFRPDSVAAFSCCFRSASFSRRFATVLRMTSCWCRNRQFSRYKKDIIQPVANSCINF